MQQPGRRRATRWWGVVAAGAMAVGVVAVAPASPVGASTRQYTVFATGLDNPRHLAIGRHGGVYVAESGRGGDSCVTGTDPESGEPTEVCAGRTGALTRISADTGVARKVLTDLPSFAGPDGGDAIGPVDVSTAEGLHVLIANAGDAPPEFASTLQGAGTLIRRVPGTGGIRTVADLAAYEASANPDGAQIDSDPYGLYTGRDGNHYVADAAGNDLLAVTKAGAISTVAVLPGGQATAPPFLGLPPGTKVPYEPVPTSVDVGPDGRPYVGQLTGFPFPEDLAKVFKIGRFGGVSGFAYGFTNIVDIDFGPDGSLYVVEIATKGLLAETGGPPVGGLWRVRPDGSKELLSGPELVAPGGVVVAGNGAVYVTINSTSSGEGKVLRYRP